MTKNEFLPLKEEEKGPHLSMKNFIDKKDVTTLKTRSIISYDNW